MKSLLILCYPTWGKNNQIHLDSKGTHIVLAPDEFNKYFMSFNINVDVVSIYEKKLTLPLFNSKIIPKCVNDVNLNNYDMYWHMFRDPTQPEVLSLLNNIPIDYSNKKIINNVNKIKDLYKENYYRILQKYNLSPTIRDDISFSDLKWTNYNYGSEISSDKKYIYTCSYNNNRGDYADRERRKRMIVEYMDNEKDGLRSFFRVGYAFGECVEGFMYYGSDWILKSGSCKIKEPYSIPENYHEKIHTTMDEIGVDVCHLEGLIINGELKIFDINPYPTASGSTLSTITEKLTKIICKGLSNV